MIKNNNYINNNINIINNYIPPKNKEYSYKCLNENLISEEHSHYFIKILKELKNDYVINNEDNSSNNESQKYNVNNMIKNNNYISNSINIFNNYIDSKKEEINKEYSYKCLNENTISKTIQKVQI